MHIVSHLLSYNKGKPHKRDFINYVNNAFFLSFKNDLLYLHFFTRQREVEGDAVASKVEVNPKFFQVLIHGLQQLKQKTTTQLELLLSNL